jgi:hypothetical protein
MRVQVLVISDSSLLTQRPIKRSVYVVVRKSNERSLASYITLIRAVLVGTSVIVAFVVFGVASASPA